MAISVRGCNTIDKIGLIIFILFYRWESTLPLKQYITLVLLLLYSDNMLKIEIKTVNYGDSLS